MLVFSLENDPRFSHTRPSYDSGCTQIVIKAGDHQCYQQTLISVCYMTTQAL